MSWFKIRNGLWHSLDASLKGALGGHARVAACGHTLADGPVKVREEMPCDDAPGSDLYFGKVCWPCRRTLKTRETIRLRMAERRAEQAAASRAASSKETD